MNIVNGLALSYNVQTPHCISCGTYHLLSQACIYPQSQYVYPYAFTYTPYTPPPIPAANTGHCRNCGDKLHECKPAKEKK